MDVLRVKHTGRHWDLRKGDVFVDAWEMEWMCVLAESPVLSQILVLILLKEREELGKFYLFNDSAVCFFFLQGRNTCLLCVWKYHSGFDSSNNIVTWGSLACSHPLLVCCSPVHHLVAPGTCQKLLVRAWAGANSLGFFVLFLFLWKVERKIFLHIKEQDPQRGT